MIEMRTELEPLPLGPTKVTGYVLDQYVRDHLRYSVHPIIRSSRPIGFELGPSMRVAYLVEGVGALARLNLRPLSPDVWQAKLHWGPRGARQHMKFQVIGSMRWVADPAEYRWQGRAKK